MNGKSTLLRLLLFVTFLQLFITGCKKDDPTVVQAGDVVNYDSNILLAWNKVYLEVERYTPGYRPPIAARALGYIGLGAYESVITGMPTYKSLAPVYPGLTIPAADKSKTYHWPTVLNAYYAHSLRLFFPTTPTLQASIIQSTENDINAGLIKRMPLDVFNRSKDYGKAVAASIYEFSKSDGTGHLAYLKPTDKTYPDGTKSGDWLRTFPDFTDPLLPNWGKCRTMAITKADMLLPKPLAYSEDVNSEFYKQAKEVQLTVNNINAGKDYLGNWIADFWSDDCAGVTMNPAGRWIAITNQVVTLKKPNLEVAVLTYAKMGMSLCDAGIAAWDQKYYWKVERPVSYIRRVMNDKNWNSIMCPDNEKVFRTPPFPAYPSGHATFGATAAEVLTSIYGNFGMSDFTHLGRTEFIGTPRYFKNFYAMAEENAFSRIPIGVHFRMDCSSGLDLGYRVAKKVNALPWK